MLIVWQYHINDDKYIALFVFGHTGTVVVLQLRGSDVYVSLIQCSSLAYYSQVCAGFESCCCKISCYCTKRLETTSYTRGSDDQVIGNVRIEEVLRVL